jgi:hypothetical protein
MPPERDRSSGKPFVLASAARRTLVLGPAALRPYIPVGLLFSARARDPAGQQRRIPRLFNCNLHYGTPVVRCQRRYKGDSLILGCNFGRTADILKENPES